MQRAHIKYEHTSGEQANTQQLGHPVEELEKQHVKEQVKKQQMSSVTHGIHVPLRRRMDQEVLARPLRLPGFISEAPSLRMESMFPDEDEFGFEDYLSDPALSTTPVDIHQEMQNKLGL
eukprot:gb/GECH01006129.1/.p1 GENE.gb/GECH01006129.1/~~gb/GECH01006129.1/.p1  ORF type:complete len:119 (+),score=35.81 gb/GECH01006129.1/:1-357(+)